MEINQAEHSLGSHSLGPQSLGNIGYIVRTGNGSFEIDQPQDSSYFDNYFDNLQDNACDRLGLSRNGIRSIYPPTNVIQYLDSRKEFKNLLTAHRCTECAFAAEIDLAIVKLCIALGDDIIRCPFSGLYVYPLLGNKVFHLILTKIVNYQLLFHSQPVTQRCSCVTYQPREVDLMELLTKVTERLYVIYQFITVNNSSPIGLTQDLREAVVFININKSVLIDQIRNQLLAPDGTYKDINTIGKIGHPFNINIRTSDLLQT